MTHAFVRVRFSQDKRLSTVNPERLVDVVIVIELPITRVMSNYVKCAGKRDAPSRAPIARRVTVMKYPNICGGIIGTTHGDARVATLRPDFMVRS